MIKMELSIDEFLNEFSSQFDNTEKSLFTFETKFKDLDEWDSLIALSIIAMADEKMGKSLTADEIRTSSTIGELYAVLKRK
jgi:acyl carrier protein